MCLGFAGTTVFGQGFADMFADRGTLNGSSVFISGSNVGASVEAFEPLHANKIGGHSVWVSWQAPNNGLLMLTTTGSGLDTLLGVYILRSGTNSPMKRLRDAPTTSG